MSLAFKIKAVFLLTLAAALGTLSSCKDDLDIRDIGEGEARVECEVNFVPLINALSSRTPGDAIKKIETLNVLIYNTDNQLIYDYNKSQLTGYDDTSESNTDMPNGNVTSGSTNNDPTYSNPVQSESSTVKAKFSLPDKLPFGRYYIYAVANVPQATIDELKNDIDALKNLELTWDPANIPGNNAMFGFFTSDKTLIGAADAFQAPSVAIDKNVTNIHAWIKRAASKVTVAFDGSGLHQNVYVYVRSVTIKNIPRSCKLGAQNSPSGVDNFYNTKESLVPGHQSTGYTEGEVVANSQLFYNSDNKLPSDNSGNATAPTAEYENGAYAAWMKIANGLGNDKGILGSTHSETANALYFYENNQGDYGDAIDKEKYNKVQKWEDVGTNIISPDQPDYRDNVPYGTYIEVEAYYDSQNTQNYSRGPIRYRFMLGKNVTYNYNAERNHHFKLTLGFKGWANQPDWHIEYDEPEPDLEVPETFRVSYVYNQSHTLPIRVRGLCEKVEVEILKNSWAPCDDKGNILTTEGSISNPNPSVNDPFAFRWARQVYVEQQAQNATLFNCAGFLALQVENDANGVIPTNILSDYQFQDRMTAVNALNDYYLGRAGAPDQHYREFTETQITPGPHDGQGPANNYEVISNGDDDRTLLIPVFTRNKSMIMGSNYSGNNPFEEYDRYAEIEVRAYIKGQSQPLRKTVKVLQTRRITNPKGIWRRWNNETGTDFHVRLSTKEIGGAYSADYVPLQSEGSWTAYIDDTTGNDFFALKTSMPGDTTKYVVYNDGKYASDGKGNKIIGKTDSFVDFYIDFTSGDNPGRTDSKCGIITVLYHNDNCVHKIMVRQGYNEPLAIMGEKPRWSSFSVFGATKTAASTDENPEFDVELTLNPLALGSMIRRGRVDEAILVSNNGGVSVPATDFSAFPTGTQNYAFGAFKLVQYNRLMTLYKNVQGKTWSNLGYANERNGKSMGKFKATVAGKQYDYRVPTFEDFKTLDNAEYAYGVCYGGGASETQMDPDMAFGFIDPENDDEGTRMGMRGIFVYNPTNANQIFFPIGKYGIGRRRMFNLDGSADEVIATNPQTVAGFRGRNWLGTLWYGDTNAPLAISKNGVGGTDTENNNWYRPMAYNVCYQRGAIYWIDQWVNATVAGTGSSCMGWDMNYYGFDFSPYTANNYQDACIIKLVVDE